MVNHHFSPPFGRICLELFPSIEEANPRLLPRKMGCFNISIHSKMVHVGYQVDDLDQVSEIFKFIFSSWNLSKLNNMDFERERPYNPLKDGGLVKKIQVGEIC